MSNAETNQSLRDLPGWIVTELSAVVPRAEYGVSVPLEDSDGVPVLRMNNLQGGRCDLSDLKYSANPQARGLLLRPLDVLFNRTNSMEHVGRTSIWSGELPRASFASYLVRLVPDTQRLDPRYLVRWLNLPATQIAIRRFATPGVHQVNINPTNLRRTPIQLPQDVGEQRKIARILATVDNLIEKTEALIAKYQSVKRGLMLDLFTRGVDGHGHLRPTHAEAPYLYKESALGWIPREWDTRTLNDVVSPSRPIAYGILMPGYGHPSGVPVIKVKNIKGGVVDTSDLLLTSPEIDHAYRRSRTKSGDLLFTIRGTVGRTAFVPPSLDGANITQDTARIGVVSGDARFIRDYLEMPIPSQFIACRTLGVAVQGINLGDVRLIPIVFPSPDEQRKIGDVLDQHDRLVLRETVNLVKLRTTRTALMQDLLTGKVRVKVDAEAANV